MTNPIQIRSESYLEIGTTIQREAGLIIRRWAMRARAEQPSAKRTHHDVLIDHLPAFLAELGRTLAETGEEDIYQHCRLAVVHGDQRWEAGWSVAELVRDYQLLRLVIVEFLQEELERTLGGKEVIALSLFIDDAIGTSVSAYLACIKEATAVDSNDEIPGMNVSLPSEEVLGIFGILGHEIRNSLAPLTNSLHILQIAGSTPATVEKTRRLMERQVKVMARLVDDLMDIPRIARGKVSLKNEYIDLNVLVQECVDDRLASFQEAGIAIKTTVPTESLWTSGDVTRLSQVVGNLLSNALKFTSRNGHVNVALVNNEQTRTAYLSVEDDGLGIDPSFLPKVFEAFNQADRSMERSRGGLGLGLALAKGLVELHGGRITVYSEGAGKGSRFMVELPLLDHSKNRTPHVESITEKKHPHRRVLVIDDNRDLAESTRMILELNSHTVVLAHSGAEGIASAKAILPDVIICDIGLPGMNGYHVCQKLCEDPVLKDSLKIALSGHGNQEDRIRATDAGFDLFLLKPVDPHQVARLVAESSKKATK